jgi:retron-type reverse transcriptase
MMMHMIAYPIDTAYTSVYDPATHSCGADTLFDQYYKIDITSPTYTYKFAVDIWGNRCFDNTGKIYQLRYDTN